MPIRGGRLQALFAIERQELVQTLNEPSDAGQPLRGRPSCEGTVGLQELAIAGDLVELVARLMPTCGARLEF